MKLKDYVFIFHLDQDHGQRSVVNSSGTRELGREVYLSGEYILPSNCGLCPRKKKLSSKPRFAKEKTSVNFQLQPLSFL